MKNENLHNRKAAIFLNYSNDIDAWADTFNVQTEGEESESEAGQRVVNLINKYIQTALSNRWIKCSERMPEEKIFVLIYDGRMQCVASHVGTAWYMSDMDAVWIRESSVTHWMPLPEKPCQLMSIKRLNIEIPRDDATLRLECMKIVKRFTDQIFNKRASFRSIAKKTNVSHELIRSIYKNPQKNLSRKVMKKFVQTCTRRDLIQTVKLVKSEKGMFTCPK